MMMPTKMVMQTADSPLLLTAIYHEGEQLYTMRNLVQILRMHADSNGDGEGITTTDIVGSGGYNGSFEM